MLFLLLLTPSASHSDSAVWQAPIEIASGNAYRGPWRMNDSAFHFVDDPTVAITANGVIAVAWADNQRQDIFLQIVEADGAKRMQKPVNISRSGNTFSWLPRLVMAEDNPDKLYVLWQEIVFSGGSHGGEIFFAHSSDGGRSFSDPLNLSNTRAGAGKGRMSKHRWHNGSLDLTISPGGVLYAAWTEYEGALRFSRSTDGGRSFSTPLRINSDTLPARGPSLAADGEKLVYLAWAVGEDDSADIHLAQSLDGGQRFEPARRVHVSHAHADAPKIVVDSNKRLHLVYAEGPSGPFGGHHIQYSYLEGDDFSVPLTIAQAPSENFHGLGFPALKLDGADGLYVLWEIFPDNPFRSQGLGFRYRSGSDNDLDPAEIVPGTLDPALGWNGSQQGLLMNKLAVSRGGRIAAVNSSFKPNESSHIWLIQGHINSEQ